MNFDQPGRMSGQVLPLKGSEHSAVDALLPFYVNGTLQGGELDRVKQHLEGCEECRREAEWLRNVFVACEAIVPVPEDSPFADTGRMRVSAGWAATQPWARMLLAAQLAAVAVLGTMLVSETRDDAPYRTLGAPVRGVAAGDSIAVRFDPTITESEMRRLLDSAGARIVDGPTATAAFLLEVPVGHSDAAVQKLRAERKVLFAEPLGARAER